MAGTVTKNKTANTGKYSYKYVDIAQIHEYLENIGMRYYQYINRIDGDDYVFTVPIDSEGNKQDPIQGARVVDATLIGVSNPAQQQGSALTYARRYSLLMAFGLATEDDDAQSLSKPEATYKKPQKPEGEYKKPQKKEIGEDKAKYLFQLISQMDAQDPLEERVRKVCAAHKVNSLAELSEAKYQTLVKQLGGIK